MNFAAFLCEDALSMDFLSVNCSSLHHKFYILQLFYVFQRVTAHGHQVRPLTCDSFFEILPQGRKAYQRRPISSRMGSS